MFVRDIQQPSVCVYGSLLIVFRYRPKLVFVSLLKINGETFRNNLGRRRGNLIFIWNDALPIMFLSRSIKSSSQELRSARRKIHRTSRNIIKAPGGVLYAYILSDTHIVYTGNIFISFVTVRGKIW